MLVIRICQNRIWKNISKSWKLAFLGICGGDFGPKSFQNTKCFGWIINYWHTKHHYGKKSKQMHPAQTHTHTRSETQTELFDQKSERKTYWRMSDIGLQKMHRLEKWQNLKWFDRFNLERSRNRFANRQLKKLWNLSHTGCEYDRLKRLA